MTTIDKYLSTENKKTLWSVLYEQGAFSGFGDNEFANIHNYFERELKSSAQNVSPNDNLFEVNKTFMVRIMQSLSAMKNKQQGVTSREISGQRQEELNERLKIHEDNLKMMINPKKPGEISFTDDTEDVPIGDNMDSLLAEKIAQRNLDIDVPASNTQQQHTWLDGASGNPTDNPQKRDSSKKKVSFDETNLLSETVVTEPNNTLTDNLFSKLKTKPSLEIEEKRDNDTDITKKLDTILRRLDKLEEAINSLKIN